jgi:hypothetical protein
MPVGPTDPVARNRESEVPSSGRCRGGSLGISNPLARHRSECTLPALPSRSHSRSRGSHVSFEEAAVRGAHAVGGADAAVRQHVAGRPDGTRVLAGDRAAVAAGLSARMAGRRARGCEAVRGEGGRRDDRRAAADDAERDEEGAAPRRPIPDRDENGSETGRNRGQVCELFTGRMANFGTCASGGRCHDELKSLREYCLQLADQQGNSTQPVRSGSV